MSLARNARRLRRLESKSGSRMTLGAWLELHNGAFAREQHAAVLMAEFARALAGTDKAAVAPPVSPSSDDATALVPQSASSQSRNNQRIWTDVIRPGPHDVLTWEEAMRVPWIEGDSEVER